MLALDPYDWAIACEVITEAQKIDMERRRNELKALIDGIGARVGDQIFRLARSMRL